jgi:NAD(P)-dependent dehydrogenase (short-subunit alcohol dehydrogenase family)
LQKQWLSGERAFLLILSENLVPIAAVRGASTFGIVPKGRAEDTSEEAWAATLNLNITSVWRMSRLIVPHMRAQGRGVIVNNASDFALVGGRQYAAYCASKGAYYSSRARWPWIMRQRAFA